MLNTIPKNERPTIATKRGTQTLWQGLAVAVIMAALTAFSAGLSATSWREWIANWELWTWAAFQAAGTAAVAWAVRRFANDEGVQN